MTNSIILCVIILIVATFFILVGITAFKLKTPMIFWSGSTVEPEEIKDVASYNKANGFMWLIYSALYVITAFLSFYKVELAGIIVGVIAVFGVPVLVLVYHKIYKKYKK